MKIEFEELQEAAAPLVKLLQEKRHPHLMVIVQQDRIELTEGVMGVPVPCND